MTVNLRGYIFDDTGTGFSSASVKLLETGTTSQVGSTFTTSSDGLWYFSGVAESTYDVQITAGSSVRNIKWNDQISLKELDVRNNTGNTTPAATFTNLTNNADNDVAYFRSLRGTGADDDEMYIRYYMDDASSNTTEVARMTVKLISASAASEDSEIRWGVAVGGSIVDVFTISNTSGGATDLTFDVAGDVTLDADGGDIFFKDGGSTFGSVTNDSGNLILKSGTTTALTFTGANAAFAGDLTISGDDLFMATNTSTAILVADGTNYNPVVPTGVIDLANDGAFTLDNTVISSQTEITSGLVVADELLYSDGGVIKKIGLDNFIEIAPTLATEDAIANGDYILFLDGGATGNMNKEAVHDLATLFAGAGMTATSSVVNVIGGDGITANSNDVAVTAAQTTITSIYNTGLILGGDAQTAIDFGTSNEIDFKADNAVRLTLTSGALYPVTDEQIDLGTSSLEFKDAFFDGTVTSDAFAGPLTGDVTGNADTATEATNVTASANNSANETVYPTFVDGATGTQGIETDTGLTYNPSTGVLTTTSVTGNLTGTVATATQNSITTMTGLVTTGATTVGALNAGSITSGLISGGSLDIDNVLINGTTIGHTDDTDLVTVADGVLTVAGELDAATLDISGDADIDGTLDTGAINASGRMIITGARYEATDPNGTGRVIQMFHDDTNGIIKTTFSGGGFSPIALMTSDAIRMTVGTSGLIGIGETSDGDITTGISINQAATDNDVISFKSSDVGHGITDFAETDTYGQFAKYLINNGGVKMQGYSELGYFVAGIRAYAGGNPNTAKTTEAMALIHMDTFEKSGTGLLSEGPSGTDNLFVVTTGPNTGSASGLDAVFIVDANGNLWFDGTSADASQAFDAYDDIALLRAVQKSVAPQDVITKEFDKFLTSNEKDLIDLGILGGTKDERGLVCLTALTQLLTGGVVQLYEKILDRDKRIEVLENKMLALGG